MASKQDQRYIEIAKACLKALNQAATTPTDREKSIQAVYDAIDTAFGKQTAVIQRELQTANDALRQIRDNTINLNDAQRIAAETLESLTAVIPGKGLH